MTAPLSENPCDPERARLIEVVSKEAATYLGVDLLKDSPARIVKIINETILKIVFGEPDPIPETEDKDIVLGCLWGAQIVREFGWSWADIRSGKTMDVAVLSPERDMAIYPFTFVADCISKRCICTVALSFNMLLERKGVSFPPKSYENIMMRIAHIVPPYVLEKKG